MKYPTLSNGNTISFGYASDNEPNPSASMDWSLTSVTNTEGRKLTFSYTSDTSGKKVCEVQEIGKNNTAGQKITFDRTKYNTTVINSYGSDGLPNTDDDLTQTYQFDEYGRTVSVKAKTADRDLGATAFEYTDGAVNADASNIKKLNRVAQSYSTGSVPVNLIKNMSFEATGNWTSAAWNGSVTYTATDDTNESYFGHKSKKISVSSFSNDARGRVYQNLSNTILVPGKTYTLSGYIKTVNVATGADDVGALLCAESFNSDSTSNTFYTDFVVGTTTPSIDNGWQRVSTTFTVPSNSSYTRINLALRKSTGDAYFDGIQVEEYEVANDVNLLENAGFEDFGANGVPTGWTDEYSNLDSSTDGQSTSEVYGGSKAFKVSGNSSLLKGIYQTVQISGTENDTYIVSGWAKANAVPKDDDDTRKFKLSVKIRYTDDTVKWIKNPATFNYSISDWQYTSAAFSLSDYDDDTNKTAKAITICVRYQNQSNTAYFDNICLVKDNAMSYTYNNDGQLISVVNNSTEKATMEYSNGDLTRSVDAKGYDYDYTYDSTTHNMTQAKSQNDVESNYTYNSKGLPTSLEVKKGSGSKLKSTITYNSTSGLPESVDDADGNTITYSYNANTGVMNSYTDGSGTTNYVYDTNTDNLKSISKSNGSQNYSVKYVYSNSGMRLIKISHNGDINNDTNYNGVDYNLNYDEFDRQTNSYVGTQLLAGYSYNATGGALSQLTYGTGATIGYQYDRFGNTNAVKHNGVTAFTWQADRSGNVTRHNDLVNHLQYDYTYDSTGRLIHETAKDTTKANNINKLYYRYEYRYDLNNNITRLACNMLGRNNVMNYTFAEDNLLDTYAINETRHVNYTYDSINRLTQTSLNTATPLVTSYTYKGSDRGSGFTTNKIASETIAGETYQYTYDSLGNITAIRNGSGSVLYSYSYDDMNQLTYVADKIRSMSYRYEYDNSGNITRETIYTLNSNNIPTSTTTINYGYSDTNWKDKLTSYDGQTITYDAIGNPLSYRDGMTMTWQNGRELATLQDGSNTISYSYDNAGVRVSKTVNGVDYKYVYLGNLLLFEQRGDMKFYYSYDANGALYSVKYTLSDNSNLLTYYFTHNSRGDIVGIYTGNGELRAKYEYDAWGNVISIKDQTGVAPASPTHIGYLNPFRYRGYYLDAETSMYYLMSRYYDPVTHRFINADSIPDTATGSPLSANQFAYCSNNPIVKQDDSGNREIDSLSVRNETAQQRKASCKALVEAQKITRQNRTCHIDININNSESISRQIVESINGIKSTVTLLNDDKNQLWGEAIIHYAGYVVGEGLSVIGSCTIISSICFGILNTAVLGPCSSMPSVLIRSGIGIGIGIGLGVGMVYTSDYLKKHCNPIDLDVVDGTVRDQSDWSLYLNPISKILGNTFGPY